MIPILTLSEMREVERAAIAGGLTEYDLIRSAGEAVFQSVKALLEASDPDPFENGLASGFEDDAASHGIPEKFDTPRPPLVMFVCGKGHNGADGLAAALHCAQAGLGVVVYHVYADRYSPETRRLRDLLSTAEVPVHTIRSAADLPVFEDADLVVDALLGSGIRGVPEGLTASLIHGVNQSDRPVLSVDIPSGIACDNAAIRGPVVRADSTLCLGALKLSALFFPSGPAYGKVGYSPIAFNEKLLSGQPSRMVMYSWDDALDHLPLNTWRTHKYSAGKVLVIAGSRGMHGAVVLSASAALRSGAGMVRAAVPAGIYPEVSHHVLEVIGTPVGKDTDRHFTPDHVAELAPWIEWAGAIVLGPGLGKHPETIAFLHALEPLLHGRKVVIDGDALALFASDPVVVPPAAPAAAEPAETSEAADTARTTDTSVPPETRSGEPTDAARTENPAALAIPAGRSGFVLTPHAGEFRRIGGVYDEEHPVRLIESARAVARRHGVSLIVKGPATVCVRADGATFVSATGNPGMATAGTGDVLAGITGRLLSVISAEDAVPLAVYLHGRAGDAARRDRGASGMTASDLFLYLPLSIKELEDALSVDEEDEDEEAL